MNWFSRREEREKHWQEQQERKSAMKDYRRYKVCIECIAYNGCVSSVWVEVSHSNFVDGIQNGGLKYFNDQRQKILNFTMPKGE